MKRTVDAAIVLARVNYGERDRIVTVLGKHTGKQSVFAKGVRGEKSRLAAGIELLSISELSFIDGASGLKTLTGARIIQHFGAITTDYDRTQVAFMLVKLIHKWAEDGAGQEYFDILQTVFVALENPDYDHRIIEVWSLLHVLSISGALPEFTVDNQQAGHFNFDHERHCFVAHPDGQFDVQDIKLLRLLSRRKQPVILNEPIGSEASLSRFCHLLLKQHVN